MLVINLFGAAGSGKSTTRAGLFFLLKSRGRVCEEAIEWVKQKVYEGNKYVFQDQLYVFAKQARILKQLKGKVDIVVNDSPLLLSLIYDKGKSKNFKALVKEEHDKYKCINILIRRVKPYQQAGRLGTEEAARQKDDEIRQMLQDLRVPFCIIPGDEEAPERIFKMIEEGWHY